MYVRVYVNRSSWGEGDFLQARVSLFCVYVGEKGGSGDVAGEGLSLFSDVAVDGVDVMEVETHSKDCGWQ